MSSEVVFINGNLTNYISVGATLEGDERPGNDYAPSTDTIKRINSLGLSEFLDKEKMNPSRCLEILESKVLESASKVKQKRFRYIKEDFINSLNFLEMICLYGGQFTMIKNNKSEDKTVLKAVIEIEAINKFLESNTTKSEKTRLKLHVERLNHLINKIFTNLRPIEQIAVGKTIERAEKILQKLGK